MNAIVAEELVKIYRSRKSEVRALDGLDLTVAEGTVVGLLGPNGAGKTTTVRILATLLRPDSGHAAVAGLDVVRQAQQIRRLIGLSGQYAAVDENLTGRENLWLFGRLYQLPSAQARRRAEDLLEQFELADAADRVVKTYSGGMRRRLDLASALTGRPRILFLDEPTTGLDPRGRLGMWDVIRGLVREGVTLLLTTQYLEEADALANTIAVVDHGDRKSTRLNSSHTVISYAVFCLKKKRGGPRNPPTRPEGSALPAPSNMSRYASPAIALMVSTRCGEL